MIHLQDIHFSYKRGAELFRGLDLKIEGGSICGLLGKNGAGKSTLMKIIAGLLFPQAGTAEVLGFQPSIRNVDMLSQLYYIPEELYLPELTVKQYRDMFGVFYPQFSNEQFDTYLQSFDFTADAKINKLSHGQKKKVIISFGLATNCPLLILDEPTNGLDIPSKSQFRKVLAGAITDDRCFLISTHQVRDIANLIDPIVILESSKIVFQEAVYDTVDKLYFGIHQGASEPDGVLYHERAPGGYQIVRENRGGEYSEIDIEALFNAVLAEPQKIEELFKKQLSHDV